MTPTPHTDQHPREALRAVLMAYRDGCETDGADFWFANAVADLGHLWHEMTGESAAGFLDAVARGVRYTESEHRAHHNAGVPLP